MNTVTDAPAWLEPALAKIGLRWPTGDASRLTAASDAWLALADQLRSGQQGADAAAASVWNTNSGQAVDAFQSWWTASAGPTANLGQAGLAAQRIGAALRAAAALVTNTQSALVTQIGPAAPVLNSTSTDAQAEAAALMPALSAARARIDGSARGVAQAIIQLLLQAFLREVSRRQSSQSRPSSRTKPREETDPQGPGGRVQPWIFDRNDGPGCKVPPNSNVIPQIVGNPDPRWVGTGILRIEARPTEADGSRATVIDGVIKNPLPDRAGFEKDWAPIRDSMGLSAPQFQAAHLWGPRFGSEAAAGILLAPGEVNQGFQSNAERFVQDLSARAQPDGWVELHAVATSQPSYAWNSPLSQNSGYNLLASADYEATVCTPNGPVETYRFGIAVPRPYVGANGAPQTRPPVVYGLPSP